MNKEKSIPMFEGKEEFDSSFIEHPYDIDVFKIIDEAKKKYPNDGVVKLMKEEANSAIFEMLEDSVVKYFKREKIDLSKNQKDRNYVLPVKYYDFYCLFFGWKIIVIDSNKIDALLCYQSAIFSKGNRASRAFLELVEFHVYDIVKNIIQPYEKKRLKKITKWLKRNRIFKYETANSTKTGFTSTLTDIQIQNIFDELLSKGNYIDKNTNRDHFRAIFRNIPLPDGFELVKWILQSNKKKPHKTALREFLTLACGKSPDQKTINVCFTDSKGGKIQLAKPKSKEYSNHCSFFEEILKH